MSAAPSQASVKMGIVWMLLAATDVNATKDSCPAHQALSALVNLPLAHISSHITV